MATPQRQRQELPDGLSPDDIDSLTELAALLGRVQPPQSTTTLSGPAGGATAAAVTGTTPLPTGPTGGGGDSAPIALKDFPAATDHLKHKLQRARAAVQALPDMGRTLAEQRAEIAELEAREAKQREVLARLRSVGLQFAREQQEGADRMEM
jgi:hypothetical protein